MVGAADGTRRWIVAFAVAAVGLTAACTGSDDAASSCGRVEGRVNGAADAVRMLRTVDDLVGASDTIVVGTVGGCSSEAGLDTMTPRTLEVDVEDVVRSDGALGEVVVVADATRVDEDGQVWGLDGMSQLDAGDRAIFFLQCRDLPACASVGHAGIVAESSDGGAIVVAGSDDGPQAELAASVDGSFGALVAAARAAAG